MNRTDSLYSDIPLWKESNLSAGTETAGETERIAEASRTENSEDRSDSAKLPVTREDRYRQIAFPLISWYETHARKLPWRENRTPYRIWISEIMLQQTRVEAVKPYYARFLSELPDIRALAEVEDDRLMKLWEGLGYYSRARNLKKAAVTICEEYGGEMPASEELLLKLPGIGSYTAGAIASQAFGLRTPAVDGNVLRVLTRVFADPTELPDEKFKKETEKEIRSLLVTCGEIDPGTFNQSLMEIGALICIPNGEPKCGECPLRNLCLAHEMGQEIHFPVKAAKKKRKIVDMTVFVVRTGQGEILLDRRGETGLLAGLYEFPNTEGTLSEEEAVRYCGEHYRAFGAVKRTIAAKHIFSHVEWHMTGYLIEAESASADGGDEFLASEQKIRSETAIPGAFQYFMKLLDDQE